MINDLGLFIGLISIALALFFGLFFGLRGFSKGISDQLAAIKEKVIEMHKTIEMAWDLLSARLAKTGTVERNLEKLGKVKITAEPAEDETSYLIEIEKAILTRITLLR